MNVAGALPAVVAVAVHAHPVVNYPATAGALAMLRAAASVQPDFVTRQQVCSRTARQNIGGNVTVRFQSQILGSRGWDVPIEATLATFERTWSWCGRRGRSSTRARRSSLFIAASIHGGTSRMPGGNNKHLCTICLSSVQLPSHGDTRAAGCGRPGLGLGVGDLGVRHAERRHAWHDRRTLWRSHIIGDLGTVGDMQAEFVLFAEPGYESLEERAQQR